MGLVRENLKMSEWRGKVEENLKNQERSGSGWEGQGERRRVCDDQVESGIIREGQGEPERAIEIFTGVRESWRGSGRV